MKIGMKMVNYGKTVKIITDKQVDISSLSEGVYFLTSVTSYIKIIKR